MTRRVRNQLSVFSMMKLTLAFAVACACIAPYYRLWSLGIVNPRQAVIGVAIVVPLVWAGLSFVLIRQGHLRSATIAVMLLCVGSVSLAYVVRITYPLVERYGYNHASTIRPLDIPGFVTAVLGIPVLSGLLVYVAFLLRRALRAEDSI